MTQTRKLGRPQYVPHVAQPWADSAPDPRLVLQFMGGLNENTTPEIVECSAGYNFDLAAGQTSLVPRAPFDLKGTAPNAGAATGFLQLIKRDNTETTLTVNGNKVYKWDGGSTFTDKGTVATPAYLRDTYWSLGDYLVITDVQLSNVVSKWDGTTFGALTTGLAQSLYAKYAVVHLNRVWLFNIKYGSTSYPHMILACKFEDPTVWDNSTRGGDATVGGGTFATGLEAFYLLVPDLKPINGVSVFQNQLIISTDHGRLWNLSGTSAKDFQFHDFHDSSPAIGSESVLNIGNDVMFVREGGAIALLSPTQDFGNVFLSNLSQWIRTTTANLSTINALVYDVLNQKVLIFTSGKVLVMFKNILAQDRYQVLSGVSPWSVYVTDDASGFNTSAAKYMWRPGTQNYSVFWGDSTGRIFDMNGVGSGDAGATAIKVYRRSRHIGTEIVSPWPWMQENLTGKVRYRRVTPIDFTVSFDWDDEYNTTQNVLSLKGPAANDPAPYFGGAFYFGGTSYFNQGFSGASRVSSMNLNPGGKGPGFYLSISTSCLVPFQVDAVELD